MRVDSFVTQQESLCSAGCAQQQKLSTQRGILSTLFTLTYFHGQRKQLTPQGSEEAEEDQKVETAPQGAVPFERLASYFFAIIAFL